MGATLTIITVVICITLNSIHKRNKKTEVIKEALQQGHSVNIDRYIN